MISVLKNKSAYSISKIFLKTVTKNKNPIETIIGFLILFVVLYFLVWSIMIAKTTSFSGYIIKTNFSNSGGIVRGADVSVNGVKIGTVHEIKLNPVDYTVDVLLLVNSKYKLPIDTKASISTYGIIGKKYIKLIIGSSSSYVIEDGSIKSNIFKSVEEIIGDLIFKDTDKK